MILYKKKNILYFGLDPTRYPKKGKLVHLPLIRTEPFAWEKVMPYFSAFHTHVLFTSRMAVSYYFMCNRTIDKSFICVGPATAERLADYDVKADFVADNPCGEGVIDLLKQIKKGPILYPHSAQARALLPAYIKKIGGIAFPFYQTVPNQVVLPDLALFDILVFTSPTTVEAFSRITSVLPPKEKCEAIGPITQNALNKLFEFPIL